MEKVFSYVKGFVGGITGFFVSLIPLSILWYVLTGGAVFEFDVITNLTSLITSLGNGGFVGFVVLLIVASFFVDKK
jgi:hypothetical protein